MSPKFISKWEQFFTIERSFSKRTVVALAISLLGFELTRSIFNYSGAYFPSIGIIAIILIGLYSGILISAFFAITLDLAMDYSFIPPIGFAFESPAEYQHFFFIVIPAFCVAILASSFRKSFSETIKARRQAELAKNQADTAKKEADLASSLMEKILNLVSHDIRNPLASISMGAQLILRTPGQSDKHQPILARMIRSLEYTDALIQSLLDVSRIRAGKTLSLEFQYCDLGAKITQMAEEMTLSEGSNINLMSCDSAWGDWAVTGIRRALENLVNNAKKYGAPNTPITISLIRKENHILITVHNEGPAISAEDQQSLFEAFHRTRDSQAKKIEGWGLGLALVKGIADSHGGTARVQSDRNTGTSFILDFPIRKLDRNVDELGVTPGLSSLPNPSAIINSNREA